MTNERDNTPPRTLDQINQEYEHLAKLIGDIEAKVAILGKKKEAILRRVFEIDLEAGLLQDPSQEQR